MRRALPQLLLAAVCLLVLPLGLRATGAVQGSATLKPSYLPALEGPRERNPFDATLRLHHEGRKTELVADAIRKGRKLLDARVETEGDSIHLILRDGGVVTLDESDFSAE